jgi:hypothetical protein
MAAILNERWHWSSTGTFLQSPPITHRNIGPVDSSVRQRVDGNQIKMAAILNELVIERNLSPDIPISHKKIGAVDPGVHQIIDRNEIQYGCLSSTIV